MTNSAALSLDGGGFGSASASTDNLNVNGNVSINSGGSLTLSSNSGGGLSAGGDLSNNGSFAAQNRTVTFAGGGTQIVDGTPSQFDLATVNISNGDTLQIDVDDSNIGGNLAVNDIGGTSGDLIIGNNNTPTVQLGANSTLPGALTIDGGSTFELAGGDLTISGGDVTVNGTYDGSGNTTTFSADNQLVGGTPDAFTLDVVEIFNTSEVTLDLDATISDLIGNSGSLAIGNGSGPAVEVQGTSSTPTVDGNLTLNGTSTFRFEGPAGENALDVSDDVIISTDATLELNNASNSDTRLRLGGDFDVSGTFTSNRQELRMDGSSSQSLLSGSVTVGKFRIDNNGGRTVTLNQNVTANGDVEIRDNISAGGTTFTFDKSGTQNLITDERADFGELSVSSTAEVDLANKSAEIAINDALIIDGTLTLGGTPVSPQLDANANLTINGTLSLGGDLSGPSVAASADLTNNGTFAANEEEVELDGGSAQTVGGFGSGNPFFDLTVNNSNGSGDGDVSFSSATTVERLLTLNSGDLNTGGNLTLASKFDGSIVTDGAIDHGGGTINAANSNVDVSQRVITEGDGSGNSSDGTTGSGSGWRTMGHPFPTDITGGDLKVAGVDTSIVVDPTKGQMIYRWDPSAGSWVGPDDDGVSPDNFDLFQGQGFLLYFFDDDEAPMDPSLTLQTEKAFPDFSSDLSTTVDGDASSNSYFIANPYPSNYDLSQLGGDFESNFQSSVEIYDPDTGSFTSIDVSSSSSDTKVGPWQGFFIEQSSGSGTQTISFPRSGISSSGTFTKATASSSPTFRTVLKKAVDDGSAIAETGQSTELADKGSEFVFRDGAEDGYDQYDFQKLQRPMFVTSRSETASAPEAAVLAVEGIKNEETVWKSIESRPKPSSFPITFDMSFDCANLETSPTTFVVGSDEEKSIPGDWVVRLRDTQEDSTVVLYAGSETSVQDQSTSYSFSVSDQECGESLSKSRSDAPGLVYDGSLTGASAKASSSTRFQVEVTNESTLPVEFGDFSGSVEGNDVILEWNTLTETSDAQVFQIQEKTADGFVDLEGEAVPAEGAENGASYERRLDDLEAGTHTLRLKQEDANGETSFTESVEVEVALEGPKLTTYPNPVRDQASVEFGVNEAADVTIGLYNTLGQKVQTIYRGPLSDNEVQTQQVNTQDLGSGLYFVRMTGDGVKVTQRMTVVK